MCEFNDKVAMVTGGASGIGRSTALRLAREGAKILLVDMNEEKLAAVKLKVEAVGGTAEIRVCDVTDDAAIEDSVQAAVDAYGRLYYGVNNAGITGPIGPLVDYELDAARQIIAIDLMAVLSCMKAQFMVMIQQGRGAIVNTSSVWGLTGGGNYTAYTAAKHGVNGATKAAALEVAQLGIRVNAVAPGFTYTPMVSEQGLTIKKDTEEYELGAAKQPMNRWGEPENMADGIAFLLSDRAEFITGTVLTIDGGFAAR